MLAKSLRTVRQLAEELPAFDEPALRRLISSPSRTASHPPSSVSAAGSISTSSSSIAGSKSGAAPAPPALLLETHCPDEYAEKP